MGKLFTWVSQFIVGTILLIPSVTVFSAIALITLLALVAITYILGIFGAIALSVVVAYLVLRGTLSYIFRKRK